VPLARRAAALGLLSFAGLLTELSWTRLAGLFFYGEAAYFVVTLAVAGLSLGAAVATFQPRLLQAPAQVSVAAGLTLLAGTLLTLQLAGWGGFGASLAAVTPTFILLGMAFTSLFASDARHAPRLYATDLLGAAMGAGLALPLFAWLGAPSGALLAAVAAMTAGGILAAARLVRGLALVGFATSLVLALLPSVRGVPLEPPPVSWTGAKSLTLELGRGGTHLATAWGTLGRSDLVERFDGSTVMYLDGSAGSLVPTPGAAASWRDDPGRLPFEALQPRDVFIVGAGAGVEVAHALEVGATRVVAAEVNEAGAKLAADLWNQPGAGTAPDPFGDPRASWVFDEARSVLASLDPSWDLIATSQAVTRTVEARGLALTENGLYTVEALRTMLASLAPGGALSFEMYDEATLTRLLFTAAVALQESSLAETDAEALAHTLAFLDPATQPPTPVLFIFREAPSETRIIGVARAAESRGMALLHLPGLLVNPPLDQVANGSASFDDLADDADGVDLHPTRDDQPFFWSFEPGIPRALQHALAIVLALAAALSVPLLLTARGADDTPWRAHVAPLLLGLAFLTLELAILSKTTLSLGHPAVALAVTLTGLLVGMGAGSVTSRRQPDAWRTVSRSLLGAALASVAWLAAWPWIDALILPASTTVRATTVLASLLPLGFILGIPFPLLLRRFGQAAGTAIPVARAWALNGVGSLVAGVGTIALAHVTGFQALALAASGTYLVTGLILMRMPDGGAARR